MSISPLHSSPSQAYSMPVSKNSGALTDQAAPIEDNSAAEFDQRVPVEDNDLVILSKESLEELVTLNQIVLAELSALKQKTPVEGEGLATNDQDEVAKSSQKTEQTDENGVKSFAYGFLGFDKPSGSESAEASESTETSETLEATEKREVSDEAKDEAEDGSDDDAYFAGRVMKGLGTLGTIIAVLV